MGTIVNEPREDSKKNDPSTPSPIEFAELEVGALSSKKVLSKRPVLMLLITALFAEIGYAALNIGTMPVYLREDRQFGESLIALILVGFLLSEAVFKSPMGMLADRFGRRTFMIVGPAICIATPLLTFLVPHHWGRLETVSILFLRVFDGIGAAMLWPSLFAAMGDATDDSERQQAMSLLNLCYLLGVALALPIAGLVNDTFHSHAASFYLASGLFAAVMISAVRQPKTVSTHKVADEHAGPEWHLLLSSLKQIPSYLALAVITFAGIGFPMPIIKLFANDQFHFSETQFGFLVLPAALMMAAFSVPMSKLGERLGRVKAVHFGMGSCALGMILIGSGAFVPLMRQAWLLALAGIPVGFGFLLAIPAWMASVSDVDCNRRAANLGAVMTAQGLGAIIGTSLGGLAYERLQPVGEQIGLGPDFGRYSPFVCCAICITLGWLIGLRILKPGEPATAPCD
ncbi:MAG: MFS transporter [Armatimonadetes bacterium]|nr:MFS transporter [Armatimonadota bacterium]